MEKKPESPQNEDEQLRSRLQQWHKAHPDATFTDMEQAVDAEMARLRRELLSGLVAEEEVAGPPACPECGQQMVRNGRKKRQVRTKDNEALTVAREQWRCLRCGMTLFPPG